MSLAAAAFLARQVSVDQVAFVAFQAHRTFQALVAFQEQAERVELTVHLVFRESAV